MSSQLVRNEGARVRRGLFVLGVVLSLLLIRLVKINFTLRTGRAWFWKVGVQIGTPVTISSFDYFSLGPGRGRKTQTSSCNPTPVIRVPMKTFHLRRRKQTVALEQKENWRPEMKLSKRLKWSRVWVKLLCVSSSMSGEIFLTLNSKNTI